MGKHPEVKEQAFGPLRFLPGPNFGRYPWCHSLFVEGAGILIDPACDRARLERLREETTVNQVWLTHWHEDHFMHLDLFEDLPLVLHRHDAPPLQNIETFMDWYGQTREEYREWWRRELTETFHFRPRTPAATFQGGEVLHAAGVEIHVVHTPGHTPGHLAFWFPQQKVLFMGDYELTPFGPYYGDYGSDIDQVIASVRRLQNEFPAAVWLACHETGVFCENPGPLWDAFLEKIEEREAKLIALLREGAKTLEEITHTWICFRKAREPKQFYEVCEGMLMGKHLERLQKQGRVLQTGELWGLVGE